jgi:hypothetical protein
MVEPVSLSVRQISAAAKDTVAKALEKHRAAFSKPNYRFGFFPPRYWCGFVIYNSNHWQITIADMHKLATDVHNGIAASVPAVKGGKVGAILMDGSLTIGFVPPIEIDLIEG